MRRRRLVIFAFHLRHIAGHHLNEVSGFRRAAEARGFQVSVYAPLDCEPAVAAMSSAERLFPPQIYATGTADDLLAAMPRGATSLDPTWQHVLARGLERDDIVVFTHGNPIALFDLARRLAGLPSTNRPAVCVKFMGGEFRELGTGVFHEHAPVHRFIAALLAETPEPERVFYTMANGRQAGSLTRLCGRRVFLMPMAMDYPDALFIGRSPGRPFTVYLHVTQAGDMEARAHDVANRLLRAEPNVAVVLKLCRYGAGKNLPLPDLSAYRDRVTLVNEAQPADDYAKLLGSANMVLLPYPRSPYQVTTSGVFCEAAASGAILIVPAATWMADELAAGRGVGVTFDEVSAGSMFTALEDAYRRRDKLSFDARRTGPSFRAVHSQDAFVERMIALVAAPPDMCADALVGDEIDFTVALGSRRFLAAGWSATEEGLGVWSDGDEASLVFAIAEVPAGPLILEMTATPFVTGGHDELCVHVSSAGNRLTDWRFRHVPGQHPQAEKRRLLIPAPLAASRPLRLDFSFDGPASPASLGLSTDTRRLGIALQRLSFRAEANSSRDLDSRHTDPS